MPVEKQRTINGSTFKLKKEKTKKSGKQYEYYVTKDDVPVTDPVYTREEGDQKFHFAINDMDDRQNSGGGGGGGNGGPLPW